MSSQNLADYLDGVAFKRLAAVETIGGGSNQHEWNGVRALVDLFGRPVGKMHIPSRFIYLDDREEEPPGAIGSLTFYDAREDDPARSELRLYYPTNDVTSLAMPGDSLIVTRRTGSNSALCVISAAGTAAESQIESLFGATRLNAGAFESSGRDALTGQGIDLSRQLILELLGIPLEPDETLSELVVEKYGAGFPPTRDFSEFARNSLPPFDLEANPDEAVVAWMEREELLFAALSKHLLSIQLDALIVESSPPRDPEPFQKMMLSHQNRSKSRAGHALENHLAYLFETIGLKFAHGAVTENNSKPDFLFPNESSYHDESFPESGLLMLGAKRTLKDRWRQVLAEADRIREKHLVTLQAPISSSQTAEMRSQHLQLVIPSPLHHEFDEDQRAWLLSLRQFVGLARSRGC